MTERAERYKPDFRGGRRATRLARGLFGDRLGLVVFLASVSLFAVYWIADWRINDSLTLYNTLYALADGNLYMTEPVYGGTLHAPGATEIDGRVYGRNYGVVVASLLPLAIVRLLRAVVDLRIAVAGLWVLGLFAATLVVGRVIGRRRAAVRWGSVGAIGLFAFNVAVVTDLDPTRGELYALQFTHLVAAGFAAVFLYRLLARMHGRRVGLFAAALLALGTPLGLWATVPKRHVVTAAVFLAIGYALYRSRAAGVAGTRGEVRFRAGAYALVGLLAWVHAPEALALFVVVAAVDLPTASRRDARALGGIGLAFLLSLVPFFVTNTLAFGSPVAAPRAVGGFGAETASAGSTGGGGGGAGGGTIPILTPFLDAIGPALRPLVQLSSLFEASLADLGRDPGRALDVFIRSGYLEGDWAAAQANHEAVNLSLLESGPVVAGVVGSIAGGAFALRQPSILLRSWPPSPRRTVDGFVLLFAVAVSLLYLSRLPIHAQITMRYLLPLFPALVYGVARLSAVRTVATAYWRTYAWTVAGTVLVGGQLVVLVLASIDLGRGEAFQFHALLGLATAAPVAGWVVLGRSEGRWGHVGAACFGLATGVATVFLLSLTVEYWLVPSGPGIPIVRTLSDVVNYL